MGPREKLAAREQEMQDMLASMKKIDAELSVLTPADPKRPALIARKAEILPRYRGAKQHVKQLRRVVNELPAESAVTTTNDDEIEWVDQDVNQKELLGKLYKVLAEAMDVYEKDPSAAFSEASREVVTDFLDWWEHEHAHEW